MTQADAKAQQQGQSKENSPELPYGQFHGYSFRSCGMDDLYWQSKLVKHNEMRLHGIGKIILTEQFASRFQIFFRKW
ncbi:MAG: hypothetical protein PHG44_07480 [Lentisphaeria bacterium]|nr:hypothetical protein [Lentisphaeria bacterium]